MPFRNSSKVTNRETDKTGFATYSDVYTIIQDNIDESSEFYEIEPAVVLSVFLNPSSLPKKTLEDGRLVPDYSYFGSIKARFIHSQSDGDVIEGYIKPLSSHITTYPLKGEIVNVTIHTGNLYYDMPLNLYNRTNLNRAVGASGEGLVLPQRIKYNRKNFAEQGDISIDGRFGHGIKFGSDAGYMYPNIKITNRQSVPDAKIIDMDFPHTQDINSDGSSIFITSGELKTELEELQPAADSIRWPPSVGGKMNGDMITINSDKVVLNAKGDGKKSNSDVHIFAGRNINLSSNFEINIGDSKGGAINLGDPNSVNTVVKTIELEDVLESLFSGLDSFLNTLAGAKDSKQIGDAADTLQKEISIIKTKKLPKIGSKIVFIADDEDDNEVTDGEVIEGESEQIFQSSGVRG